MFSRHKCQQSRSGTKLVSGRMDGCPFFSIESDRQESKAADFFIPQVSQLMIQFLQRWQERGIYLDPAEAEAEQIINAFEEDPFRNAFEPISNQDCGMGSIESVPTSCSKLISRIIPKEGVLKTIVSPKNWR